MSFLKRARYLFLMGRCRNRVYLLPKEPVLHESQNVFSRNVHESQNVFGEKAHESQNVFGEKAHESQNVGRLGQEFV